MCQYKIFKFISTCKGFFEEDFSMYTTKDNKVMDIIDNEMLRQNEISEKLMNETRTFQSELKDFMDKFFSRLYDEKKDPGWIKMHFTTQIITNITRKELLDLDIWGFFDALKENTEWYKIESFLQPLLQKEFSEDLLKIFEDIKSVIKKYVINRIIRFENDQAIFKVDYEYRNYPATDWPYIQSVAIEHLGPNINRIQFLIIRHERFDTSIQSTMPHPDDMAMVAPSTSIAPQEITTESITRHE